MINSSNEKFNNARKDFILSLSGKVEKISSITDDIMENELPEIERKLMIDAHNLSSICKSYNMSTLADIAREIEILITESSQQKRNLEISEKEKLIELRANLRQEAESIANKSDIELEDPEGIPCANPLIFVVDSEKSIANQISDQIDRIGAESVVIEDINQLPEKVKEKKPDAVIVDMFCDENKTPRSPNVISEIIKDGTEFPVIYLSDKDDIETRLLAVRNFGTSFLQRNFSLFDLRNAVESVLPIKYHEKSKVLIIDDDKSMSAFCSAILEQANVSVKAINNAFEIFEEINNFDPDVILLDMYMPQISGIEIAHILRQHNHYTTTPIVIMSGETDMNKQFNTRSAGADDFILKPFQPRHLVDVIYSRIKRSRQTKKLISSDGLTGLPLFSKVKDSVIALLDSCFRHKLEFSIAMIDLDKFKDINDKHGHLVGDAVLRELSDFLIPRVRKSDIVTRYGGEEFLIVFPYTSKDNAYIAMNLLREEFAEHISAVLSESKINATFSGGISSIKDTKELSAMIANADEALYQAKNNGRNIIEIFKSDFFNL